MVCSKCGQELREGVKFCTQCGEKFKNTASLILPIISITLTVIWIVLGLSQVIYNLDFRPLPALGIYIFGFLGTILPFIAILLALIAQKKQESSISFLAGVIPVVCAMIVRIFYFFYWNEVWR